MLSSALFLVSAAHVLLLGYRLGVDQSAFINPNQCKKLSKRVLFLLPLVILQLLVLLFACLGRRPGALGECGLTTDAMCRQHSPIEPIHTG